MFNPDPYSLLDDLKLSEERIQKRRQYIGASEAPIIASGDAAKINKLARIKRGIETPDDLSGVLPIAIGSYTEALNIAWFIKTTGRNVHSFQKECIPTALPFLRATLDGITTTQDGQEATFQAKHVNPFKKFEDVVLYYMPQLQHEMYCSGLGWCVFSCLIGNLEQKTIEIERDDWYIAQLIEQERLFWAAVQAGRDPELIPPTPVEGKKGVFYKAYDFSDNNFWADAANDWIEQRPLATLFESAVKRLKESFPADALSVKGHGVIGTRSKNGAITIKPYVEEQVNEDQ